MKFGYIDSMRGIAILMVVFVHTSLSIPELSYFSFLGKLAVYSQMGVQLFFVASAYTLCLSFEKRCNEKHSILNYITRRFFRIAPAYYIIGILGNFLLALAKEYGQQDNLSIPEKYSAINVLTNITFIHGFYPPSNNTIVPGGWSIGTEVAFYALFPIVMTFALHYHSRYKRLVLFLPVAALLGSLTIQSVIYAITGQLVADNNFIYFNIINQFPVFILGITAYFLSEKASKHFTSPKIALLGFVFFTLLSFLVWQSHALFKFALIPTLSGISFVFLLDLFKSTPRLNLLILRRIGELSYSIYLIHSVFAWDISKALNSAVLSKVVEPELALIAAYLISVTGSFCCALITERLIEKPFVECGRRLIQRREKRLAKS